MIRFYMAARSETLLATSDQPAVTTSGALNFLPAEPKWLCLRDGGTWVWNDFLSLTLNRMFIILFSLLVFAGLMWLLKRVVWGWKYARFRKTVLWLATWVFAQIG